jgi:hypothetical protein
MADSGAVFQQRGRLGFSFPLRRNWNSCFRIPKKSASSGLKKD